MYLFSILVYVSFDLPSEMSDRPPVLVNKPELTDIFNGAQCRNYSWAQTHADLEIRIKLAKPTRYEDVNVILSENKICVELFHSETIRQRFDPGLPTEVLVEGEFEHPIDVGSAYWLIQKDEPTIIIYIDKREEMWWKHLLLNEEVTEIGPRNYTVPMDGLDEGSRMAIAKLISEQKQKIVQRADDFTSV